MVKCDVIQDLLPLYIDDVASEGSREEIDEHLKSCPVCQEVLQNMQSISDPARINVDKAEIGAFKKMKKKLRVKSILIAIASVLATLTFIYGVFIHTIAVPFNSEKISLDVGYDTVVNINFEGNYTGIAARAEGDTLFLGYYGTVFTRLVRPSEPLIFSIGSNIAVDFGRNSANVPISEQINRVYYLDFRTIRTDTSDLSETRKHAVLIWER